MSISNIVFENIKMKNFKCFSEMEMDFSKNEFIIITGNNGRGKTSIIDAISYALYDKPLNENTLADSIVNKKANKDCSVILKFKVDGDSYKIERYRKHKKYKDSKSLFKNGKDISGSTIEETNKKIENIVCTKNVFLSSIVFTPHSKKTFISSKYPEQKDIIDNMLSLEIFDSYFENSKVKIKGIDTKIDNLKNDLLKSDLQIDNFKNNIKESIISLIENSRKEYYLNRKNLLSKYVALNSEESTLKIECGNIDLIKSNIKNIEKEISELSNEISNIEKSKNSEFLKLENYINKIRIEYKDNLQINFIDKIAEFENKINEISSNYRIKCNEIEKNESNNKLKIMNKKQELVNEYNSKMSDYDYKIRDLIDDINNMTLIVKDLSNDFETVKNDINKYENELQSKKCSACGQNLPIENEQIILNNINKSKEKLENIKNQLIENRKKNIDIVNIKEQQKNLKSIDKTKYEELLNKFDIKIEEQTNKIKKYLDDLKFEYDNEIKDIKKQKYKIEGEMLSYKEKNENDIKNKENKIKENLNNKFKERLNGLLILKSNKENELFKYDSELRIYEEKNKRLININNEKEIIKNKIIGYKNNYKTNRKLVLNKIDNYKQNIKSFKINKEKINIDIDNFMKEKSIAEFWKTGFGDLGIRSILFEEAIPILNKKAMELSNLVENLRVSFDSQTKFNSKDKYSNKFSINVVHSKNLSEYNELSAGETRLVHIIILLCLRHLLETMSGIRMNILLLDEMLDSLDEENSKIVIDIIKKLSEEYCVMLISHTHKKWIPADREYKL